MHYIKQHPVLSPCQTVTTETTMIWAQRVFSDFKKKVAVDDPVKHKAQGCCMESCSFWGKQ